MDQAILDAALYYLINYKFAVVPMRPDKGGTYVLWKEFQGRLPTEAEVKDWFTKWPEAMIGVVTGPVSDLIAVDIDLYKLKEKEQAKIYELIPKTINGPISISPEGGHHRLFRYPDNGTILKSATDIMPGLDIKALKGIVTMPPSINQDGNPHRWMGNTGITDVPLSQLDSFIIKSLNSIINKGHNIQENGNHNKPFQSISNHNIILNEGRRGETLFHIANSLIRGGMKRENAQEVLRIIANNCNPPFEEKEIPARINSALGRMSDRAESLTSDLREWIEISNGWFSVSNAYESISKAGKPFQSISKAQIRVILHRLSKTNPPLVEKDTNRDGWFRRVMTDITEVDWINVDVKEIPVKYPFAIHQEFITMPKNIIIISGTSNSGKSAFLLDFVNKNMDKFKGKIHYFSSEMGAMELKARILHFGYDLDFWKDKFKFYERAGNFSDIIKPDEINIIDYLDVTDEFWKVGTYIKDIFDKLNNGIALIALQKNPEKEYGRGGAMSIEKSRLYISIDPGKVKLVKAKNWRTEVNPNGLYKTFKLVKGCSFRETSNGWLKDEKDFDNNYKFREREPGEEG